MNWLLLANSFLVAGASTLLALVLGLAIAVTLTASAGWLRQVLMMLAIATLALPAFLVTNCWIDLLGANGRLHSFLPINIYSLKGAILILGLLFWPIPALGIFCAWRKLEKEQFEIDAAMRGADLFRFLLWPAARSAVVIAAAITFTLALNNFAVPSILQVKTFPAEVWVLFNTNLNALAALQTSWPMLLAPLVLVIALRRQEFTWPRESASGIAIAFRRQLGTAWLRMSALACVATVLLSLVVPLVELMGTARTWGEFVPAFTAGTSAATNSFVYAAGSAALTLLFALFTARLRGLGWLWVFFLAPGLLLGIAAVALFNRPGFEFFFRTAAIVVFVLSVRHFALARSLTRSAYQSIDQDLIDGARLDGARGINLFGWIIFPQIAQPVAAAAYLVYVLCLWDVETILLVIPPGGETLALRIFGLLHYGHNAHVNALCLLLLLLGIAPLILFAVAIALKRRFEKIGKASLKPGRACFTAIAAMLIFFAAGCRKQSRDLSNTFPIQSSIFSHVEVVGSRGTGPGQFNKPRSLALDTNDNLFVVDMTGRVQKFSPDGKFLLSWQMPQTDIGKPKGMDRDREGNIVILEPHYQRVNHFTPEGTLVAQWGVKGTNAGELTLPRAIAVDTKNNVIVSEYTLVDRLQKFSAQGKQCLATWGTQGLAAGQFNRAEGVGVDAKDRIYVADSCAHRVQIFSSDGKFLRAYGKAGTAKGEMNYPYDIRVDEKGRQYVCEYGGSRIQVFDANDRPVEIIGKPGSEPGEFDKPWSIAFDSKGNLYVADSMNHRVQKLVRKRNA